MQHIEIEDRFNEIGGQFISSAFDLTEKLKEIKAFVFMWDGVFNDGQTNDKAGSTYNEVDKQGLNMMRFAYWVAHKELPKTAVITANESANAHYFAKQENLNAYYYKTANKEKALLHFCDANGLTPKEVCLFWGDADDLPSAEAAGITFCVGRLCNPVFMHYVVENRKCDYVSACQGGEHAARELTELTLCLLGNSNEVFEQYGNSIEFDNFKKALQENEFMAFRLDGKSETGIGYKANQ